ncbi:hypothetical protein CK203_049896 [Vitis vinifera]|uniref:Uncharacterized protein n=1 Tax=Vitis vinifera TaxID=29760 RepID=A0A438GVY5_VITVI|nr:hypothetical protein CK203_049896 [Vitis vinifera]
MWSSTLTTSSTISLPLRLRSTFHQLLNMVARATWYDGSHCYKDFKCPKFVSATSSELHHLKREIRVWKSSLKSIIVTRYNGWRRTSNTIQTPFLGAPTMSFRHHFQALQQPFRRHLVQMGSVAKTSLQPVPLVVAVTSSRPAISFWPERTEVVLAGDAARLDAPTCSKGFYLPGDAAAPMA